MNFEVGDEPPSVAAYRADGTKPPAADLTGIYARFPTGPSSDELAAGTTAWLKANKPGVLDSKVEKAFREREWLIVWTPPYCPKFQPIELVWGVGKQRAGTLYKVVGARWPRGGTCAGVGMGERARARRALQRAT